MIQDRCEGTIFHMLARNVFDKEIIDVITKNYDNEAIKEALYKKKINLEFNNENITCFDIAESSDDVQTREIFDRLENNH